MPKGWFLRKTGPNSANKPIYLFCSAFLLLTEKSGSLMLISRLGPLYEPFRKHPSRSREWRGNCNWNTRAALYHPMNRENQGRLIFGDEADCKLFLETLAEVCQKTGCEVHAGELVIGESPVPQTAAIPNIKEAKSRRLRRGGNR